MAFLDAQDRQAFLLGVFQSLLLGALMRFYGLVLAAAAPFVIGLGFAGFALGARVTARGSGAGRQWRFLASLILLSFLLLSRLYYVNFFKAFFTGQWPAGRLALLAGGVLLACHAFGYAGFRYAATLRHSAHPALNYALLAVGFAAGSVAAGLTGGAFLGVASPEFLVLLTLLSAWFIVDIPQRTRILVPAALLLLPVMVFLPRAQFGRIAWTWGVRDYKHAADAWSPYYKIDLITFKNDTVMWGLYNYTGMLLAARDFHDMEAAAPMNEALYLAAMPRGARTALILGSGGGMGHPGLFSPSMQSVTAVEIDPVIVDLMKTRFAAYNRGFYNDPRVTPVIAEGRAFLERRDTPNYDYIEYESLDTRLYTAAMNVVPVENRLYTREGLAAALKRLNGPGLMRITVGTEDDAGVVQPIVSSLPPDVYYAVYRVRIDMGKLTGVQGGTRDTGLAGWEKDLPHTAILVAKQQQTLDRVRAWRQALPPADKARIQRVAAPRDPARALTDNRPFIGGAGPGGRTLWLIVLAVCVLPAFVAVRRKRDGPRPRGMSFFYLIGAGYVGLEILFLALGARHSLNPAWTTLWLAALFVLGNAAACAAASARPPGRLVLGAAMLALGAGILAAAPLTRTPLAAMAASAAAGFLGGLFWPAALARVQPAARGAALSRDALGTLPGIVVFNASLYLMGISAAARCVAGLYLLAWLVFAVRFPGAAPQARAKN